MRHSNIALFVPHQGCSCKCSFCNQHTITGVKDLPQALDLQRAVETAATHLGADIHSAQLAFFGGSFTAIPPSYMLQLLQEGARLVEKFGLAGIRVSTRPDYITPEILQTLRIHKVCAVELGAQSMDNRVLAMNRRGHTAQQVAHSAALVQQAGLELGLQMMTGLYGATPQSDYNTAVEITGLCPSTVRIYPTVVFKDTELCHLYSKGQYQPQTLGAAVALCARLIPLFEQENIRLIRVGLHAGQGLEHAVAGPYHPAFMELCRSAIFYKTLTQRLVQMGCKQAQVLVHPKALSQALGQKKENLTRLAQQGYAVTIQADPRILAGDLQIVNTKGEPEHAPTILGNTGL